MLSGDNGQGKTNLLEAIYLLGHAAQLSRRQDRGDGALRRGRRRACGRAWRSWRPQRLLEVTLAPGHKSARVDGKGARASDYFGGFNVVLFAPEDLRLPKGPPSGRRRFLDRAVWNAHPAYLGEVQTYEKVLRSRNAVLRDGGAAAPASMLEVYDEQLAQAAVADRHAAARARRRAAAARAGGVRAGDADRAGARRSAMRPQLDIGDIERSMARQADAPIGARIWRAARPRRGRTSTIWS